MNDQPTISVILSAYNSQKTLAEAIESILQQTYRDFELILIDDGSSDSTPSILQEFASQDERIKIITNEENIGLTRSLNKGLQIARGDFIARMDADDISLPDRFEKQIDFFKLNPDIVLLGGRYEIINELGYKIGECDPIFQTDFLIRWRMLYFNAIIHSTVMFRSQCLKDVKGYDETLPYAQDYEFWIRIMQTGKATNMPDILIRQRHTETMISSQFRDEQKKIANQTAKKNLLAFCEEIGISNADFTKLQSYYSNGIGLIQSTQDKTQISNWLKIYRAFCKKYHPSRKEDKHLKEWFQKKVIVFNSTLLKQPQIILHFPLISLFFLVKNTINRIIHFPQRLLLLINQKHLLPKIITQYVNIRNYINYKKRKPKIFIYTDSRGMFVDNSYLKHPGIFPFYAFHILNQYQIEYHTCEEKHTTIMDFLRVYENSTKDFKFVIAHIGIVDFSPRPASSIADIYSLKKEMFDKIFPADTLKKHFHSGLGTTYEGEDTNNLYSLDMADKYVIPEMNKIPGLIWISSNRFVKNWRGNYFKDRPENISITESYAEHFCAQLHHTICLLNWNENQIMEYTCDNIHLTNKGFKILSHLITNKISSLSEKNQTNG